MSSLTREQQDSLQSVLSDWQATDGNGGPTSEQYAEFYERLLAIRALPAGEVVAPVAQGCPTPEACDAQGCRLLCTDASPAPVAAEEGPMNLLRKCVTGLEAEADGGWSPAAKSHLSKARVALNMLPAPANESPVDKQTTEG